MVQTLADGQVITSVSTPIGTTRVTTVPPTNVVVTDVETPTGDTKIVVEATTHTLTHSGYFIGKFLPPIVAVLLAMGIRALNQQGGALGREALLLSFDGWMSIYLPFKLLFNNQPLPFLTSLALWASSIAAPLSSEAVGLKIYGSCKKGAIDGCALELGLPTHSSVFSVQSPFCSSSHSVLSVDIGELVCLRIPGVLLTRRRLLLVTPRFDRWELKIGKN
ncbi:hypothetical protein LB503_005049 [Fusarium chuoi]|nr:hypothetical protein LB503_005049 [Fusarium chuoi]